MPGRSAWVAAKEIFTRHSGRLNSDRRKAAQGIPGPSLQIRRSPGFPCAARAGAQTLQVGTSHPRRLLLLRGRLRAVSALSSRRILLFCDCGQAGVLGFTRIVSRGKPCNRRRPTPTGDRDRAGENYRCSREWPVWVRLQLTSVEGSVSDAPADRFLPNPPIIPSLFGASSAPA